MELAEEVEQLRRVLQENSYLYHVLDRPSMSDYEYDHTLRRLEDLERDHPELITPNSPTQVVGGKAAERFAPIAHEVPLESLQDVFSVDELFEFDTRLREMIPDCVYSVEPKVDGLSVALTFENGVFTCAATRGDGLIGEDVTANIRTIKSVPLTLQTPVEHLVVRGEVYMPRTVFAELNEQREQNDEPLFANPRNAAAGSLRQLDPKIVSARKLDIVFFNVQTVTGQDFASHEESLAWLAELHFRVIEHTMCSDMQTAAAVVAEIGTRRGDYPYDIDGAVVKVNAFRARAALGSTAKCPRWAAAFKYPPEQKPTIILDIVVQVGRTGVLTPKATLSPVRLAGTTVTSASLHNQDFISEKDIRIGDTVLVQKAGEIIPEVVKVLFEKRSEGVKPYTLPTVCPVCGADAVREITYTVLKKTGETRERESTALRCTGAECPAQLLRNLTHFASRDAMDIDGLGEAVVELLVQHELIKTPADLYQLTVQDVARLKGMGLLSGEKLIAAIVQSKQNDLSKLLFALGIAQVGQKAAKQLAASFRTLDALRAASEEALKNTSDIGLITAKSLLSWFQRAQSQHLLAALEAAGVNMICTLPPPETRFVGLIFVLTGTMETLSRVEAGAKIEALGGKVSDSVSKKTSFVVAGEKAGSKLTKAQQLGLPILTETEFLAKLEETPEGVAETTD